MNFPNARPFLLNNPQQFADEVAQASKQFESLRKALYEPLPRINGVVETRPLPLDRQSAKAQLVHYVGNGLTCLEVLMKPDVTRGTELRVLNIYKPEIERAFRAARVEVNDPVALHQMDQLERGLIDIFHQVEQAAGRSAGTAGSSSPQR